MSVSGISEHTAETLTRDETQILSASGNALISIPYWEWPALDGARGGRRASEEDGEREVGSKEVDTGGCSKSGEDQTSAAVQNGRLKRLEEARREYLWGLLQNDRVVI
jgi:hypothetical protein